MDYTMELKLAKIRQLYKSEKIQEPVRDFESLLKQNNFIQAISERKKIAIAVGSRGIKNIDKFIKVLVQHLKTHNCSPFIVPAMGSHGGATAEGQTEILKKLGISEKTINAPIISSMEVKSVGEVNVKSQKYPTYIDKAASESDGIILINRIKHHTGFYGDYESGLVKMIVIGLGNKTGATFMHRLGPDGLENIMPMIAKHIIQKEKILGGFCIVEDAYCDTARIYWIGKDEIFSRESEILKEAKRLAPHLPIDNINLLLVKQMGKNISGTGIDTKVVGRIYIKGVDEPPKPKIDLIGISDLTDESCGNAAGVGLADFITDRLYKKMDIYTTMTNVLTTRFFARGKIPIVLKNDRELIEVAMDYFSGLRIENPKTILIKNTLNLIEMYVSESVLKELKGRNNIEILSELKNVQYDKAGYLQIDL